MAWTTADIPDQRGRVAVVTGANSGLGRETSRELARKGARVVVAARDQAKAQDACEDIRTEIPRADLDVRPLDLASLESVRACAAAILADHARVDVLVCNAGVMGIPEQASADGFEMQLAVNHLGHFVLTARLLPALLRAPAARVVSVTSFARLIGRTVHPANPHLHGRYNPWGAYGQSKLANLHFAVELQRRLDAVGATVVSLAAHPGLSRTDLQARSVRDSGGGLQQRFWYAASRRIGMPPERGAGSLLRAATDPGASGGEMYGPRWATFGPPVRRPLPGWPPRHTHCRTLWRVSEEQTGEVFDVAAIVREAT